MDIHSVREQVSHLIREVAAEVEWPDIDCAIAQTLSAAVAEPRPSMLPLLPALTYLAAGGKGETAIPLTASWLLYRLAAKVLDDVADEDASGGVPWRNWHQGRAMNVGLGLIFLAQSCLARMQAGAAAQREIHEAISQMLAFMARGQAHPPTKPDLEDYMRYTYLKAGVFFGTFAWAGARLQTRNSRITRALLDFGSALGTLIQIYDDLDDLV
ncbi:partial Octaprenyl diphosphate synthase, partial [Anaerolineae bacterium]